MSNENGKTFSIVCDNELQCFAYDIERLDNGKYALEKLDSVDEIIGDNKYKRNFYLKNSVPEGNDLLLVTIKGKKIVINRYILDRKTLKVQKNVANISYDIVTSDQDSEVEFQYIEDMKKSICVFDIKQKQEVIPACFYNQKENKISGKYKLAKNQKYMILKFVKNLNNKNSWNNRYAN